MSNYLIAGASKGIGHQLAKQLLNEGHSIHNCSRTPSDLPGVNNIELDLAAENFSFTPPDNLDGLAYCLGTINLKPFHRLTEEDFLADYKINVLSAVKLIQTCLPALQKSSSASIVLFSTVAASTGMGFHTSIASAKSALTGLGLSLAAELAPKIRVNIIAPSLTETPLSERLLSNDTQKGAANKRHPLQRYGQPKDVANAAEFLLTEKSSWVTGQIINVDGGLGSLRLL
jgi:3-oxoacyl-[acyl-carrier protein] reductase